MADIIGKPEDDLSKEEIEDKKEEIRDIASKVREIWDKKDVELFDEICQEQGIEVRPLTAEDKEYANTDYKRAASYLMVIDGKEYFSDRSAETLISLLSFHERQSRN